MKVLVEKVLTHGVSKKGRNIYKLFVKSGVDGHQGDVVDLVSRSEVVEGQVLDIYPTKPDILYFSKG
jgi:hypothetical protein